MFQTFALFSVYILFVWIRSALDYHRCGAVKPRTYFVACDCATGCCAPATYIFADYMRLAHVKLFVWNTEAIIYTWYILISWSKFWTNSRDSTKHIVCYHGPWQQKASYYLRCDRRLSFLSRLSRSHAQRSLNGSLVENITKMPQKVILRSFSGYFGVIIFNNSGHCCFRRKHKRWLITW